MAVKTVDIVLSEFEQGGFYVNSGGNYSSSQEVRTSSSNKIAIPDMFSSGNIINLTIISEGNKWSFGGYNSSNYFVDMRPEASGYKESGTIIDISSYTQTRTLRIELHNDNGITPPQEALLRVKYEDGATWEMDLDSNPIPVKALPLLAGSFTKPFPASIWRIDKNNNGFPYNELMPDVLYIGSEPPTPGPSPAPSPIDEPIHITINDIKNADAGNSYSNGNWVKPWYNIDNKTYEQIRGKDAIIPVLNSNEESQYTCYPIDDDIIFYEKE